MRISDWSSDVCSSDLLRPWPESRSPEVHARRAPRRPGVGNSAAPAMIMTTLLRLVFAVALGGLFTLAPASAARSPSSNPAELPQACDVDRDEIGRASCRDRVCPSL